MEYCGSSDRTEPLAGGTVTRVAETVTSEQGKVRKVCLVVDIDVQLCR